jgi:hypothetical protein
LPRQYLGRRQRAIVRQLQAAGLLVLFLGFLCGMFVAGGTSVLGAFALLLGLALLEPLALSAAADRTGHHRLAALFGVLGALAYLGAAIAIVAFALPIGSAPLQAIVERLVAAGVLTGAAAATLDAARALWQVADDGPLALGSRPTGGHAKALPSACPRTVPASEPSRLPTTALSGATCFSLLAVGA